jgi:hypothetical protein
MLCALLYSSCLLTYFGSFGNLCNSSVGSVNSRLQNVKTHLRCVIVRYQHQVLWNKGLFSSTAEVSGFLECQLHVERIVLYFFAAPLDVLNLNCDVLLGA